MNKLALQERKSIAEKEKIKLVPMTCQFCKKLFGLAYTLDNKIWATCGCCYIELRAPGIELSKL